MGVSLCASDDSGRVKNDSLSCVDADDEEEAGYGM